MAFQPLALVPPTAPPFVEVPGLAYYTAPAVPTLPPRIVKSVSPGAEALAQMYGYYAAAD